jgi:hypothetical protein
MTVFVTVGTLDAVKFGGGAATGVALGEGLGEGDKPSIATAAMSSNSRIRVSYGLVSGSSAFRVHRELSAGVLSP